MAILKYTAKLLFGKFEQADLQSSTVFETSSTYLLKAIGKFIVFLPAHVVEAIAFIYLAVPCLRFFFKKPRLETHAYKG